MSKLVIASAQTRPKNEDIAENLQDHYRLIQIASDNGVELIVFPEMSITGYVRESAQKLSFASDDSRIDKLRSLASEKNMIIIAGAPVKIDADLHIGAYIIFPNNSVSIYTKQFLHTEEALFFKPNFSYNPFIELENERFCIAICADITNPKHAENAKSSKCSVYIASIFYTPMSIDKAYSSLSKYAKIHSMNVLMSNYCGESWGCESAGKSAFWTKDGNYLAGLDIESTGLVICQKTKDSWNGKVIKEKKMMY